MEQGLFASPRAELAYAVSCVMVTPATPIRFERMLESIRQFLAQTYARKELVIVLDDPAPQDEARLREWLAASGASGILIEAVHPKRSLGALRNRSIALARGELVCQWDDDDGHHPRRIETQVAAFADPACGATFLQNVFHFFPEQGEVFWSEWGRTRLRGHPATLMYRRALPVRYPEVGEESERGEDKNVLDWLKMNTQVRFIDNPPYLYTYVYHGTNTWHFEHHRFLASKFSRSRLNLLVERERVEASLKEAGLRQPVQVMDQLGSAFRTAGQ